MLLWHTFYRFLTAVVGCRANIVYGAMSAVLYKHIDKWQQSITRKEGLFSFYHTSGTNKYKGILLKYLVNSPSATHSVTRWCCLCTAWATCPAHSNLWSSVPSSSSAVCSSKIIWVCGDWLVLPFAINPFVVSQISFPKFFVWKIPFNCSIVSHFCFVWRGIWLDGLSSSSLPALRACCPACCFVHWMDEKFPAAERGKYTVQWSLASNFPGKSNVL